MEREYDIFKRMSSANNFSEALDSFLEQIKTLVGYERSCIYLLDDEQQQLTLKTLQGTEEESIDRYFEVDDIYQQVVKEGKWLLSPDLSKDLRLAKLAPTQGTLMVIPLAVEDGVIGILTIYSATPNFYTQEQAKVLTALAAQTLRLYDVTGSLDTVIKYVANVLDSIASGVIMINKDGKIIICNNTAQNILGLSSEELLGKSLPEVIDKLEDVHQGNGEFSELIKKAAQKNETYTNPTISYVDPYDRPKKLCLNYSPLNSKDGHALGAILVLRDITEEKQDKISHSDDPAIISRLAVNLAHEIRNPLSSVKGAAQYLQKEYEDHRAVREFTQIINEEVQRLNKITTDFLFFARPTYLDLRYHDIKDIIKKTLQVIEPDITGQNVEVIKNIEDDLPPVMVDYEQLKQVFLNLMINSLHAMPNGGRLVIEASIEKVNPPDVLYHPRQIKIAIADTGIGIPEENLDKIFIPFFTTKTKGSGLGLSIVQQIVESHGGYIEVGSTTGKGTTFFIYLPVDRQSNQGILL